MMHGLFPISRRSKFKTILDLGDWRILQVNTRRLVTTLTVAVQVTTRIFERIDPRLPSITGLCGSRMRFQRSQSSS
jgi:hypothetical protein